MASEINIFMELLKQAGLKNTKPRMEILKVLEQSNSPLTAEEIYAKLNKKDINLSTVYRTLNTFDNCHIVKKEINKRKENIFSLEGEDTHILVCVKCHRSIPLKGCPYHEANEELEKTTGFLIEDHNTEIYGVCPDCQKK